MTEEEEIKEHQRRFMDWDAVHIAYCCEKTLLPSRIAERTGMETVDVQDEVKRLVRKLTQCKIL